MMDLFKLILGVMASLFKSRAKLEAEILILRQQINVLRRRAPKRPHLNNTDRFPFGWLYHWFPSVLGAIAISGRKRLFAGTAGFERIGAGDHATMLTDRRSRLNCSRSLGSGAPHTL
jgi:hypothetical protein